MSHRTTPMWQKSLLAVLLGILVYVLLQGNSVFRPRQTVCDADWTQGWRHSTTGFDILNHQDERVRHLEALLDTGSVVTLIANCVLTDLEQEGIATRLMETEKVRGISEKPMTLQAWRITGQFGPYRLPDLVVYAHHKNTSQATLGLDVLLPTRTVLLPTSDGYQAQWLPSLEEKAQ